MLFGAIWSYLDKDQNSQSVMPPYKYFDPPIGGVRGVGVISTPISHFIGGLESVEILGI